MKGKKTRILFEPISTGLGHIIRCLSIANELKSENFNITFAVKKERCDFIKSAGFDKVYPLTEEEDKPDFFQKIQSFSKPGYIEQCIAEELKIIDDFKPNLIISDGRYTTGISARATKIKWISIVLAIQIPSGIKAAAEPLYKVRDSNKKALESWLQIIFPHGVKPMLASMGPDTFLAIAEKNARNFHPFLEKFKLPLVNSVYDLLLSPELSFIPSTPSISVVPELPINTYYIGPQPASQYVGPIFSNSDYNLSHFDLEIDDERPVIYVTFGGMAGVVRDRVGKVYEIILQVLGNTDVQVVIANPDLRLKNLPENIQITPYVPSNLILRLKNVILLCHGGLGTLMENLAYGNASIALPFSIEQLSNAERIKELGAGMWMYPNQIEPSNICAMVDEIKNNPRYKEGARKVQQDIAAYQGAGLAVKLLKGHL
ncbi:MAG TPA: nucleotide disphospho-sugar-binding domain-containing protein [bacterium]|nr:nucleotide disphospho-sugar-binding domain-containing protein [bacterium]